MNNNIPHLIKTFKNLPPFPNTDEIEVIKASILETFKILKIEHDPYFCFQTIYQEGGEEWDRMLYICDDKIPVISFYCADSQGTLTFVDIYGNIFANELKLIQSFNHKKYCKYYNVKKVFTVPGFDSDEEYLKGLVENYEMLDCNEIAKMIEMFVDSLEVQNAIKAIKIIKNYYRFFLQLKRNYLRFTEFNIGNPPEVLVIKLNESIRKVETTIEVNMKKLNLESPHISFTKLMWRLNLENTESQKVEEDKKVKISLPSSVVTAGCSTSVENYLITMNRNFTEDVDFLTKCNSLADKISQKYFQNSVTLSQFKNIVMWLRERLSHEYETDEEVMKEYQYLFFQVKNFCFKDFKYVHIFSAVYHVYKHFDEMINKECFANYRRILDLKMCNEDEKIIGKLIKTPNYSKLLKDCFGFFFNFLPSKLFVKENLILWQSTGSYQAFTYTNGKITGAQVTFGFTSPLSIVTMFTFESGGDMEITDGQKTDFQETSEETSE